VGAANRGQVTKNVTFHSQLPRDAGQARSCDVGCDAIDIAIDKRKVYS